MKSAALDPAPRHPRLTWLSPSLALVVMAFGYTVLVGWFWDRPLLYRVFPEMPPMVPNTALGFLLAGLALLLLYPAAATRGRIAFSQVCAVACLLLGLATLCEYLLPALEISVIDRLLVGLFPREPFALRPSPYTALTFVLAGAALALLGTRWRAGMQAGLWLAALALIIPGIVLFGYVYGKAVLYTYRDLIGMALPTAIGFTLLLLGILLARPGDGLMKLVTEDAIGGRLLRRILPLAVLAPLLLGWLIHYGEANSLYSSDIAFALSQITTLVVLIGIIVYMVRLTNREEDRPKSVEAHLRKTEDSLREFALHLEKAREDERSMVARNIHDEVGGILTALKMDMGVLASRLKQEKVGSSIQQRVQKTSEHIDLLMQTVQRIISDLRPSVLDNLGLLDAIEWQLSMLWKRYGIQYNYDRYLNEADSKFPDPSYATNIFRIFQEITTNITKHARASMVTVFVTSIDQAFVMSVSDNGCGMPEEQAIRPDAFGMISMRERVHGMRGECHILSKQGVGTTITLSIPMAAAAGARPPHQQKGAGTA